MYEESFLKSDCAPGRNSKKMCVDTIDVVTSYKKNRQQLSLAVSITDLFGYPIFKSGVEVVIVSPSGMKFSLETMTDPYGVALFELDNIERGRWKIVVSDIHHPSYRYSTSKNGKQWSFTDV